MFSRSAAYSVFHITRALSDPRRAHVLDRAGADRREAAERHRGVTRELRYGSSSRSPRRLGGRRWMTSKKAVHGCVLEMLGQLDRLSAIAAHRVRILVVDVIVVHDLGLAIPLDR